MEERFYLAKFRSVGILFSVLAIAVLCVNSLAQVTTARLDGIVQDSTGAVIPGATVKAISEATNISYETVTSDVGRYIFPALAPGSYSLSAELPGFKRHLETGLTLELGDSVTLNISLQLGEITESVTVTSERPTVDTTSQSVGAVVNEKKILDLPLVTRDPMDLIDLVAGTIEGRTDGLRTQANNVTIDGINNQDPMLGDRATDTQAPVPLEAVGEYVVVTSNASAEYGRGAGAQVQMVYKSGTNEFHGSVFEFHRNKVLNANSFFGNRAGLERPTFLRNQFGFNIGGPIVKNKAFFHLTYEGIREKQDSLANALVFTPTLRDQGSFRYAIGGRNSSSLVDSNGNPTIPADQIGTIDLANIDPTRLGKDPSGNFDRLVGIFPNPNNYDIGDGFNTGGYRFLGVDPFKNDQLVIKGDYAISDRHRLALTYAGRTRDDKSPPLLYGLVTDGHPRSYSLQRFPAGIIAMNSSFTPTLLNEMRLGGTSRLWQSQNGNPDRFKPEGAIVFSSLGGPNRGHPYSTFLPQAGPSPTYTLADSVTWIRGNHTLKGGFDIRYNQSNVAFGGDAYIPRIDTRSSGGNPSSIPTLEGLHSSDRSTARHMVNDFTGTVGRIQQSFYAFVPDTYAPFETKLRRWRSQEYSMFFQDTWKVNSNLTLNLGFRWEILPPTYEDGEAGGTLAYPKGGIDGLLGISGSKGETFIGLLPGGGKEGQYETDWNNFAPNLGFTWDPWGSGKSSFSANYRISYDRTWMVTTLFQDYSQEGMGTVRHVFGEDLSPSHRLADLASHFVPGQGYADPGVPLGPIPFNRQGTVTMWDPSYYTPYTGSWAFRFQHEVMRRTVLQISYVGNKATGLPRGVNFNQIASRSNGFLDGFIAAQRNLAANGDPLVGEATGSFGQVFGVMTTSHQSSQYNNIRQGRMPDVANYIDRSRWTSAYLPAAGLGLNFFRTNPQFDRAYATGNNSNSTWHGLKIELNRRFSDGLMFQFNYTFSKGLTDYEGGQSQRNPYRDNLNRGLDKQIVGIDRPHFLKGNWIASLPWGNGQRWMNDIHPVLNAIIGGWQVNGIVNYQSGDPFTISSGRRHLTMGDSSSADCNGCTSTMTGSVTKDGDSILYLTDAQKSKFSDPVAGSAGLTAYNFFRMQGTWNMDGSFFKEFGGIPFVSGEDAKLQFRFEWFNAFNHTNFTSRNTTITSGSFGKISAAQGPRIVQVALKFIF